MRKSWLPAYLALGTVWGCSFIFIELGLEFLTPFGVTFIRCALGAITLIIIARIRKIDLPTDRKVWQKLWVVALLLNVIPGVLFAFAQQYVTSVFASIINAATPLMTLVFILVIFREEKLKREQIFGLLIGALGVMTVVGVWKELGDNQLVGVLALLIAVSCYGASYPYSTRNVIPGVLFAFAQQYVTSVFASIINAATPLMTLVFILVIFREEKLKREQIYGLLIGALGVMTVVGVWKELGDNQLVGVIALLIAVSCYGASYPYSTRNVIPLKLKPEALAAGQLIMAAITLLPLFLINGISNNSYPRQSVIAMLCLGIFGSGFAYIWNFSITAAAGSAIASSVTYLTPVVAVIVGRLYLGEVIVWHEIVGAIIVILGALLSQGRLNRLVKTK